MSDQKDSTYLLATSIEEQSRLDLQHWFTKKCAYGGSLIVDKSVKLGKDAKVLDAGTGTGAWILDLANSEGDELKSATLIGIDMSTEKFSPNIPQNVQLMEQGILDLPEKWNNTFDFVHQRLLIAGLKAEDWPKVLRGYFHILKPGGHIQLCEVWPAKLAKNGPAGEKIAGIYKALSDKVGLMSDCADRLGAMLGDAGFDKVEANIKKGKIGKLHGEDGVKGASTVTGAYKAQLQVFVNNGLAKSKEEMLGFVKDMEDEWDGKDNCCSTYVVVTAMKPMQK